MTDKQAEELLSVLRSINDGIWNLRETMVVRLTDGQKNELFRRLELRKEDRNKDLQG